MDQTHQIPTYKQILMKPPLLNTSFHHRVSDTYGLKMHGNKQYFLHGLSAGVRVTSHSKVLSDMGKPADLDA
jgi:hypothetical protein